MIAHVPGPFERLVCRLQRRFAAWLDTICVEPPPIVAARVEPLAESRRGRKRSVELEEVRERIADAGGEISGSYEELGQRLGLSKPSAHRALNALAAAGVVTLAATPVGTLVRLA